METLPIRLGPGSDLRQALEASACGDDNPAFVIARIGSLRAARIRLAGRQDADALDGEFEIFTLSGPVAPGAAHLHVAVADAAGHVIGGHVAYACIVRTTVEALLLRLPDGSFARVPDPRTGFAELVVRRR